jgi:hypothetical protein
MRRRILTLAALLLSLQLGGWDQTVNAAPAVAASHPHVGVAPKLWNNKAYSRWLKRFRQDLQQNLSILQQQQALGSRQAEQRRLEMLRRAHEQMEAASALQQQDQAARRLQDATRRQSCLAACLAPTPCGPEKAGLPARSCPAVLFQCQSQCRN